MTTFSDEMPSLDVREQVTRIDQMLADIHKNQAQAGRLRQEIRIAPWLAVFAGATAAATVFAAGAAVGAIFVKVFNL
jgi:hypothetical protein